jgi:hypothetical protein
MLCSAIGVLEADLAHGREKRAIGDQMMNRKDRRVDVGLKHILPHGLLPAQHPVTEEVPDDVLRAEGEECLVIAAGDRLVTASHWKEREAHLFEVCWTLAELQCDRQVPGTNAPTEGQLQDRPFRFVDTLKIAEGLKSAISDVNLRQMPLFGGADQFLGNYVLAVPEWSVTAVGALLRSPLRGS